jgi:hypothetical protein
MHAECTQKIAMHEEREERSGRGAVILTQYAR